MTPPDEGKKWNRLRVRRFLPVVLPAPESGYQCSVLELKRQKALRLQGFSGT
jgi:hypothetical protein